MFRLPSGHDGGNSRILKHIFDLFKPKLGHCYQHEMLKVREPTQGRVKNRVGNFVNFNRVYDPSLWKLCEARGIFHKILGGRAEQRSYMNAITVDLPCHP